MTSGMEACDAPLAQAFDSFDALTVERERQKRRVSEEESAVKHLEQLLAEKQREAGQMGLDAERCSSELAMLERRLPLLEESCGSNRRSLLMLTQMRDLLRLSLQQERDKTAQMLSTMNTQLQVARKRWTKYEAVYLTMPSFLKQTELMQLRKEDKQLSALKEVLQAERQSLISDQEFCVQLAEYWTRSRLLEGAISERSYRPMIGKGGTDAGSVQSEAASTGFTTATSPTSCTGNDMEVNTAAGEEGTASGVQNIREELASPMQMEITDSMQQDKTSTEQSEERCLFLSNSEPNSTRGDRTTHGGRQSEDRYTTMQNQYVPVVQHLHTSMPTLPSDALPSKIQRISEAASSNEQHERHPLFTPCLRPISSEVDANHSRQPAVSQTAAVSSADQRPATPCPPPMSAPTPRAPSSQRSSFLIQMPSLRRGGANRTAAVTARPQPAPSPPQTPAIPTPLQIRLQMRDTQLGASPVGQSPVKDSITPSTRSVHEQSLTKPHEATTSISMHPPSIPQNDFNAQKSQEKGAAPQFAVPANRGLRGRSQTSPEHTAPVVSTWQRPCLTQPTSAEATQLCAPASPSQRENASAVARQLPSPPRPTQSCPIPPKSPSMLNGPDGKLGRSYWVPIPDELPERYSFVQQLRQSPEATRRDVYSLRPPSRPAPSVGTDAVCLNSPFLTPSVPPQRQATPASTPQVRCATPAPSAPSPAPKQTSIFDTPVRPPPAGPGKERSTPERPSPSAAAAGDTPATPCAPPPTSVNIFASPEVHSNQMDAPFSLFGGALNAKQPSPDSQPVQSSMSLFGAGDASADGEQAADDFSFNFFGGGNRGSGNKETSSTTTSSGVFNFF